MPTWVKAAVDRWLTASGISTGPIFRAINKAKGIGTGGFSPKGDLGRRESRILEVCGLGSRLHRTTFAVLARAFVMRQAASLNRFSSRSVLSAFRQQNDTSAASSGSEMRLTKLRLTTKSALNQRRLEDFHSHRPTSRSLYAYL